MKLPPSWLSASYMLIAPALLLSLRLRQLSDSDSKLKGVLLARLSSLSESKSGSSIPSNAARQALSACESRELDSLAVVPRATTLASSSAASVTCEAAASSAPPTDPSAWLGALPASLDAVVAAMETPSNETA